MDSGAHGKTWLRNRKVAGTIKNTFHFYDNVRYDLICYTIMPNHIHLIILPKIESYQYFLKKHISKGKSEKTFYFISKIMQDIKKFTSNKSNKILNRTGKFWQSESYDHAIRNKKELKETVRYILNNPVKAGLCKTSEDWEWNYYNPKFLV